MEHDRVEEQPEGSGVESHGESVPSGADKPFVMPNEPPPNAEIDEIGGLPKREPDSDQAISEARVVEILHENIEPGAFKR